MPANETRRRFVLRSVFGSKSQLGSFVLITKERRSSPPPTQKGSSNRNYEACAMLTDTNEETPILEVASVFFETISEREIRYAALASSR